MRPKLKLSKKHYWWAGGILAFLLLTNTLLSIWAKNSFPEFVKDRNDTDYNFEFAELNFSLLSQSLTLREISIYPKKDSAANLDVDFKADIKKIKITFISLFDLIKNKELAAHKIYISEPNIHYYRSKPKLKKESKTNFQNVIQISHFVLENATVRLYEEDKKTLISGVNKLNFEISGVRLDKETVEKKIPFEFSTYQIACESFFYRLNPSQEMKSRHLKANDKLFSLLGFSIQTTDSLAVVNSVENNYRLLPEVNSKDFRINGMDWGFSKSDEFYFKSSKITFDSTQLKIPENKNISQKEKKEGYLIPFLLDVERISVINSEIEVENSLKVSEINLEIGRVNTEKDKKLEIDSILLDRPVITLVPDRRPKEISAALVSSFREHIELKKLHIRQAKVFEYENGTDDLNSVSENLNLELVEVGVLPRPFYNHYLKNDNFKIIIGKMKLSTDRLEIGEKTRKNQPANSAKPLLPVNLEIDKIDFQTQSLEKKNHFLIKPVNVSMQGLNNEIEGKLKLGSLKLGQTEITMFSSNSKKTNTAAKPILNGVEVDKFEIENAGLKLIDSRQKELLSLREIHLVLDKIKSDEKNSFEYQNALLTANSLNYHSEGNYDLSAAKLSYSNQSLKISQFQLKPRTGKAQFVKNLKKQKDYYSIKANEISIQNPAIGFPKKVFSLKTPQITIEGADACIYRSKIPPDDTSKKKMYSQLLREMKFGLEVRKLSIRNSKLIYEEETEKSNGAGKLSFTNFSAEISNINSGYGRSALPDVKAVINTTFMDDSRLKVNWVFNPVNRTEKFNISGNIYNFDAKRMTPFVKPYLYATAEGNIKEVNFNFTGNDVAANGDFGIKYKDLKVTLYNPKTGQPRKTLSAIGNLALKSNTNGKVNEVKIKEVERKQDKSFFNFFWLCVQQGLKQSVLII